MICDHASECIASKCPHKGQHVKNDMCHGRNNSITCSIIDKKVGCLGETEEEKFKQWWDDNYKGKLGQIMIEKTFEEVAWKTWQARANDGKA